MYSVLLLGHYNETLFGLKIFSPYAGSALPAGSGQCELVPRCLEIAPAGDTACESRSLFPERVDTDHSETS